MRLILIKFHLYLGLVGGVLLCAVALTGAAYAYEPQVRAWWGERVTPATEADLLAPTEISARLRADGWTGRPVLFLWPGEKALPLWVGWDDGSGIRQNILLDPVTGERLPRAEQAQAFFHVILDLHRTLASGDTGKLIVGLSAIALISLAVTGLFISVRRWKDAGRIWFPRRSERQRSTTPRLRWRYWHRIIGAWTTPLLLLTALTGMVWSFDSYASFLRSLGGPARFPSGPTVDAEQRPLTQALLEKVWQQSLEAREGEGAMRLVLPTAANLPLRFEWSPPGVASSAMRSRLYFHPTTGEPLERQAWEDFSAGEKLVRWAYPIHTGKVWGVFGQTLALLTSLSLPFFFITGLYLYLARRKQKSVAPDLIKAQPCNYRQPNNAPSRSC